MEKSRSEIVFPTIKQVINVNRQMIQTSGGTFIPPSNFNNSAPLEYILTAIAKPIYGIHLFDSLEKKASALAYEIIVSHVFIDGNKRTGAHMAWMFLRSNGINIIIDKSIEDITIKLATGTASRADFTKWINEHQ